MKAFFYGDEDERIFGVIREPYQMQNDCGIVICNSLGQEYIRSNRAMVYLAKEITKNGYLNCRFDFPGIGNSSKEFEEIGMEQCVSGLERAIKYIKDNYKIKKIILLGLRLGCNVIEHYCNDHNPDGIVLWHPIIEGKKYLNQLKKSHNDWLYSSFVGKQKSFKGKKEYLGYLYNNILLRDIENINLHIQNGNHIGLILTHENKQFEKDNDELKNFNEQLFLSNSEKFWNKNESKSISIPIHDIKKIVSWLKSNFK